MILPDYNWLPFPCFLWQKVIESFAIYTFSSIFRAHILYQILQRLYCIASFTKIALGVNDIYFFLCLIL